MTTRVVGNKSVNNGTVYIRIYSVFLEVDFAKLNFLNSAECININRIFHNFTSWHSINIASWLGC
jgi:hypothetical protein